eukprot:TRINITY_DN87995_c0_g1_i1.p1 TRINITY_DN87995_c0_g1~~TRINITY_DN87995_c0_g1_i1.p1  ORF type:complete len:235 (-),score=32.92 TRINITY_DN87995_c0_g1_i1:252-956(-)
MAYETADVESLVSEESVAPQTASRLRWVLPTVMLLSVGLVGAVPSVLSNQPGQATVEPQEHQSDAEPASEATVRQQLELDPNFDGCYKKGMYYADPVKIPGSARTKEANPAACQARCTATSGCSHFTFWSDGGCLLTGFASRLKASPAKHSDTVVGPKVCALPTSTSPATVDWSIDVPPAVNPDAVAITVDDSFIPTVSPVIVKLTPGVNGTVCSAYPQCVRGLEHGRQLLPKR